MLNFYLETPIRGSLRLTITLKFHIGATSQGKFSTISGEHFPTVDVWLAFLTHNRNLIKIVDETGKESSVEHIIEMFNQPANTSQQEWLKENGYTIHSTPKPFSYNHHEYWTDRGHLFTNGSFA